MFINTKSFLQRENTAGKSNWRRKALDRKLRRRVGSVCHQRQSSDMRWLPQPVESQLQRVTRVSGQERTSGKEEMWLKYGLQLVI